MRHVLQLHPSIWSFVGLTSALLLSGCGGGSSALGTAPVTGKVTYKGQPVAGATVTFVGEGDARSATAITREDGTYSLMTLDSEGAVPGKYMVLVTKTEISPELSKDVSMEEAAANADKPVPPPKKLLPEKYGDPTKGGYGPFEVKSGSNTLDINLEG